MKPIPRRTRIPILTDLLEFRKVTDDPLGFCEDIVRKYGNVCYVPLPGVKNYLIHDPEIIKEILVTQSSKFCKSRLYIAMKKFLGEGLLTSDGALHRQQQRLVAPAFQRQRIQNYAQTMVRCTVEETDRWRDGDLVNISQAMVNIAMKVITQTMFATNIDAEVMAKVSAITFELIQLTAKIFQNPVLLICYEKNLKIPIIRKFYRLKAEVDEIINGIISSYRVSENEERDDLLSMLMKTKDEDTGLLMSDTQIRDEVMTMFMAGHETTSTALSWTWYMLGRHPEIFQLFNDEIREKIGSRLPTADDYQSLPVTRNIFKETLRLYPPAWTYARAVVEDVEIQGYRFPRGSLVCSLMYLVQRDEKYYDQPNDFIPSRWDNPAMKDLPRFAYFPFGGGNRQCIGEGFAWMEAVMILSTIASRFTLELPQGFTTSIRALFTLRPKDDIVMRVRRI